ncbi:hypothetical protein ISF6_2023 [Piscinibacter sakaiensis]|uniref:Uncharacterized protein n=1 Tax=Piscinibacter sakaiensis TaxID=1547922 RepID=A0A0K8P0N0_PISS1|nr:hypothetical protein ISF6_2023 [Piscinibacter sakaiensis]
MRPRGPRDNPRIVRPFRTILSPSRPYRPAGCLPRLHAMPSTGGDHCRRHP